MKNTVEFYLFWALMAIVVMAMSGCGGGGNSSSAGGNGAISYSISGTVTANGTGLSGVTITVTGNTSTSATTGTNGNFSISGLGNGSYTLIPTKTSYSFSPASQYVTVNGSDLTGKKYTATTSSGTTTVAIQLPKTGQTVSYAAGDDGALEKGVSWPDPRFTSNGNGTITDNLTGLIWLEDANCFGEQTWPSALILSNTLASGRCGLTDGSTAGQWRLPNINELESLVDISQRNPFIFTSNYPFTSVQSSRFDRYLSSSTLVFSPDAAWVVFMQTGSMDIIGKGSWGSNFVWPVR